MPGVKMSLSELQTKWCELCDMDRAHAVHEIYKAGTSFRALARALNCSLSLIRHLDLAAQAPLDDRNLARQGKMSTRELVRRAKAVNLQQTSRENEALEFERIQAANAGCRLICNWLEIENIPKGHGEQVIQEAQRSLATAERKKKFPKYPAPRDMPPTEIIRLSGPPQTVRDSFDVVTLYGAWLTRWVWYVFPDVTVRDRALDLALDEQPKRIRPWRRHPLALKPEESRHLL